MSRPFTMKLVHKIQHTARLTVLTSSLAAMLAGVLTANPASASEAPPAIYTLDTVLELALAKHPSIASAGALIDRQQGRQLAAGAYPNPTVTGYLGYGEVRDTGRANIRESLDREHLTEYNVTVGQPLEWPAMRAARQQAADAGVATAIAGSSETRLSLTAQVKVAFYDLLLAQQDAALAKQNLDIVERVARIVKARVKSGEGPQFEAIKADVEVLKARQQLARAENAVRVNQAIVNTLTGGSLEANYQIHGTFADRFHETDLEALTSRMTLQHPTMERLRNSVEQADRGLELERQLRMPSPTVNGSYWREIGREALQGGLTIPLPLWYQRQGEIAASLGEKRREETELLRTRYELARAIHQHYQDARTTANLIEVFEQGLLKQAHEALRLAQFSFQQGASSLLEVFDAQRVQRQIQMDYAQARYDLSVSLARLELAVGGPL